MNIVEEIARMIDCEGAYGERFDNTRPEAKPCEPTTRQKYWRARYDHIAVGVVKRLAMFRSDELKSQLVEFEKAGWRKLNVPIDDPALKPSADRIIADKYGLRE